MESTSQWVSRTFGGGFVATNISCQEIPYQTTKITEAIELLMEKEKHQESEGKLWS